MLDPGRLAGLAFFEGVPPRALHELAARAVERTYVTGETLFAAGEPARGLHVVIAGRVRVLRGTGAAGGRRHVLHVELPGGTLGEVPLLAGGGYPATAEAMEPTTCVVLSRSALEAAVSADPTFAWLLLARLAERVRSLVQRLDGLMLRGVTSRLAALLVAQHVGARSDIITLGMTQSQAAEELGTVREVVVRSLRELRELGAIAPAGSGRYRVVDLDRLQRLALADGEAHVSGGDGP